MKKAQLSGSSRANVGKKDAKALRNAGLVPCVLYGNGTQTHFSIKDIAIQKLVYNPDVFQIESQQMLSYHRCPIQFGIRLDCKKASAVIQDLQQNPITDKVMHVDFLELDAKKPVKLGLPVRVIGNSRGVLAGGKLMQVFRRLRVEALPGDLPEAITVDITKLRIGQSIRVKDLESDGLKLLEAKNAVVVAVKMARGASKAAEADDDDDE